MLTPIQKLAINKLEVANTESVAPGTYRVEPFTIEISGTLRVTASTQVTPTTSIPLIPTLALAIKRMGIQREPFMEKLLEVMGEVLTADADARTAMVADLGLAEFEETLKTKVLSQLPKVPRAGAVRADLNVAVVASGVAS